MAKSSHSRSLCGLSLLCFEFLKDSNCFLDGTVFHQLVTSMTDASNAQARATFSYASFLKQKRRKSLVSHFLPQTHESVKLALLAIPSSSLFSDDIIKESLAQVKEDS